MPYFPAESDTSIAFLTEAGRNLLARSIILRSKDTGNEQDKTLVTFKLAGFAVGDGGYELSNPLQVLPITNAGQTASATIAILDNRFDVNDKLVINGVDFAVGILEVDSGTALSGTDNGGTIPGYAFGPIDNSGGFGGTLDVTPGSIQTNAHIGQRLRIVGGTLLGLDEQIVANTQNYIEIGVLEPQAPLPTGSPLGKSWNQAGAAGLLPDTSTTWQILTESPGINTWVPGTTLEATALNLADAINSSVSPKIKNVVKATANNAIVTLEALTAGSLGNINTLVEYDAGGLGINNFGIVPGTGNLGGGADDTLESPRYPADAPNTVAPFDAIEVPNSSAVSLLCRVPQTDGNYGLGEVGIYADIVDSVNPDEIGARILYAVGHFPIVAKNNKSVFVTRIITQY